MLPMSVISQWIAPLGWILSGVVAGIVFEKLIFFKLKKLSQRTKWEGDDIIVFAMRGITTFLFVLLGMYCAGSTLPVQEVFLKTFQKFILIAAIFSITLFLARLTAGFVGLYARKKEGILPSTTILTNFTKLAVFLLGSLVALQSLGISITPILTALGVGGLAVALALQDTLSNLFSGLYLIVARQISPGDYIKLDSGEEGYIADVSWRNTTIRALANNMIMVPNAKLAAAIITNYYQPVKEMGVLIPVGVSYDSDLERVERITIEVAKEAMRETPGCVAAFEPVVRYHTFGEYSIDFSVILRVNEFVDQYLLKHEFIKRLHRRYQQERIDIPYPIRTVYWENQAEKEG